MTISMPTRRVAVPVLMVVVFLAVAASPCVAVMLGGWSDIPNAKADQGVQNLGSLCVNKYNMMHGGRLEFVEVVSGRLQVVDGMKFLLRIRALDGGATKLFGAQLLVRPFPGHQDLIFFEPVNV